MPKVDASGEIIGWDQRTWREYWDSLPHKEKEEIARIVKDTPRAGPSPGPQAMAYSSEADVVGMGGSAGGGKSALIALKVLYQHTRCAVFRNDSTQISGLIDNIVQFHGTDHGLNRQWGVFRFGDRPEHMLEWGGLEKPGAELKWQGREHDLIAVDEAAEVEKTKIDFVLGWLRTSDPKQKCQALFTFNPPSDARGRWVIEYFAPWIDPRHPLYPYPAGEMLWYYVDENGQEQLADGPEPFTIDLNGKEFEVRPQSRTFIPANVTDNPYLMETNYRQQLLQLKEPKRSQLLLGDFFAGIQDDQWQVIPTEWVEEAMERWTEEGRRRPMWSLGVDVARGGKCNTVFAAQHAGFWWDNLEVIPGASTPNGPIVAGKAMSMARDGALICIDAEGIGASPFDILDQNMANVQGIRSGWALRLPRLEEAMEFRNLRSLMWWFMRKLLDPSNGKAPSLPNDKALLLELTSPRWDMIGNKCYIEPKPDIVKRVGYSPDRADAVIYSNYESIYGRTSETASLFAGRRSRTGITSIPYPESTGDRREWMNY